MGIACSRSSRPVIGAAVLNTVRKSIIARLRWKTAVKRVKLILLRRERWAEEGRALQSKQIQSLVDGLERKRGKLHRARPAQK